MIRSFMKYLIPILLAVLVFSVAMHLDSGPRVPKPRVSMMETTEPSAEATEYHPTQTEPDVQPVPVTTEPPETEPAQTEPAQERFLLTFAGDCTLGSSPGLWYIPTSFVNLVGEDYGYPFRNVAPYFAEDDLTIINLEGVLGESGVPADKEFTFRGPSEYINILTEGSVEAVTLANNHSLDYGFKGYENTKALLTDHGVAYAERDSSVLVTTDSGLTVGIYAASFAIDQKDLEQEVAQLREHGAEVVVFAIHWGAEGSYRAASNQVEQAYEAIDAGVDIVYGSHPHVLQKVESYNGGVIFYSMGNFSFGGNHFPPDMDTVVIQQEVFRDADGTVTLGELILIPCSISSIPDQNNFQPTPYPEGSEEYGRAMSKLLGTWTGLDLRVSY